MNIILMKLTRKAIVKLISSQEKKRILMKSRMKIKKIIIIIEFILMKILIEITINSSTMMKIFIKIEEEKVKIKTQDEKTNSMTLKQMRRLRKPKIGKKKSMLKFKLKFSFFLWPNSSMALKIMMSTFYFRKRTKSVTLSHCVLGTVLSLGKKAYFL